MPLGGGRAAKFLDTPPPADTTACRAGAVVVHNHVNEKEAFQIR
jgi:hypothetical protein